MTKRDNKSKKVTISMINDWSLGDLDCLIILAIGDKGNKSMKIHKMVIILSKLLNIQMDTEVYQGYSEAVAERLNSRSNAQIFAKIDNKYKLTEQGREIYYELLDQLRAKNREDVVALLNALRKMSNKNLLALTYFLYPETYEKSGIKDDVNKIIESLKEKGKKNFKFKREDNKITIEIP